MKKNIFNLTFMIVLVGVTLLGGAPSAKAAGVCVYQNNPTTLTKDECTATDKFLLGYRWDDTRTYAPGVCRDAANQPVNFNEADCKKNVALGFKWDPWGNPPQCFPPKVLQDNQCRDASELLGTCRLDYTEYSKPRSQFRRTKKRDCTEIGETWHPSTKAEYDAEVAAYNHTGDDNTDSGSYNPITTYNLLSPLPCPPNSSGAVCDDSQLVSYDTSDENSLGNLVNIVIIIFIGGCGVIAVVVIVIGGLEYMTSELPGNKEHGKHRITNAFLGLALACGSWVILYEINPDLLDTKVAFIGTCTIPEKPAVAATERDCESQGGSWSSAFTVEVEIMDETETFASALDGDSPFAPGIVTSRCPEGIFRTASGAPACKSIIANFDKMIADAKLAGKNISGYGYRNIANQTQLRMAHCHGDITNRNAPCDPPTALPGASNHNHGLAFDLRCNGQKIANVTNECFVWLKANASKYGLRNLPSEPWHWSVDGR